MSVKNWRHIKGNQLYKELYRVLRQIGFSSYEANRLKQKSLKNINNAIYTKQIHKEIEKGDYVLYHNGGPHVVRILEIDQYKAMVNDGHETYDVLPHLLEPLLNAENIVLKELN